VKKAEAEAKTKSLKEANDKLKLSGEVAIRPTADCKGVTICKAGASAPEVRVVPFADSVVVPHEPVKPAVVIPPVAPIAPPHPPISHADVKPIVPSTSKVGTHDPKSPNYWDREKK
jgi:hypothetical protein